MVSAAPGSGTGSYGCCVHLISSWHLAAPCALLPASAQPSDAGVREPCTLHERNPNEGVQEEWGGYQTVDCIDVTPMCAIPVLSRWLSLCLLQIKGTKWTATKWIRDKCSSPDCLGFEQAP